RATDASLSSHQDNSKALTNDLKSYNALINELNLNSSDLGNLNASQLKFYNEQKDMLKNTYDSNKAKLDAANLEINTAQSELKRIDALLTKEIQNKQRLQKVLDIIAKKDYNEAVKNVINLQEQKDMAGFKLKEARKKYEEINKENKNAVKNIKSSWLQTALEKQKESRELDAQINAILFSNKTQQIKSPADGFVGKLLVHTEGGVVTPNDNLISIVPSNVPLIIKANVLNKDVGFLKTGQEVAIKIDTFNFQKYGLLHGKLSFISNDAIEDEKLGLIYEIKIDPNDLSIKVDGEMKQLEIGMSVTAEVKVGKRRVIEFFIYPIIQYLDEGLSVR
ncbi:MAG: HlyD family efflux transporter periplasmic adaptor subunit, partial [Campylobacter sp.]|nr:HlyD family efflux transporter periplasmic adaptor subunit [Campylobacter sp.]